MFIGAPAVGPLIASLSATDRNQREGAAIALGRLGAAEAVPALVTASGDEQEWVRKAAAEALVRIDPDGSLRAPRA